MRPTWLIAALCLVATGAVNWVAVRAERADTLQSFEATTVRIAEEIEAVLGNYEQLLRAGAGLYSASGDIQEAQWSAFIRTMGLEKQFPGVQGIGFSRIVTRDQIANHEAEMRRRGKIGYSLYPAGEREIYTAIEFLEPQSWRNQRAIGFDMFSEAKRRSAMERARDTGLPTITRGVTLVQETSENVQVGALMYFPVFRMGPSASIPAAEATRTLHGYVYAAFRMTDLLTQEVRSHLPSLLESVALRIWDAAQDPAAVLLYQSHPQVTRLEEAKLHLDRQVAIAGQVWRLEFAALPTFQATTRWARPGIVLFAGLLVSALITVIAATLALARAQAIANQRELSAEVEARTEAQRQVQIANQELIHRVKNMMAVVTAIAAQTARYTPNPAEFNKVFRERLAALGRVHDLLKTNPTYMPEIASLAAEILKPYTDGRSASLDVDGPQIEISQSAAVMLSLVLNELATNAIKYGAWSQPSGRVAVSWSVMQDNGDDKITMEWRESGGPPVETPRHRGFGTNVLKFAIEQGLRGSFEPRYLDSGLHCSWEFPRHRVAESADVQPTRSY